MAGVQLGSNEFDVPVWNMYNGRQRRKHNANLPPPSISKVSPPFQKSVPSFQNPFSTFQCTRHATSCNNIKLGANWRGNDEDPGLSIYGINEAIKLAAKEKQTERFKMPPFPISVSALIRTWETAVLLYGYDLHTKPKIGEETVLELRISPCLRETNSTGIPAFDVGNRPMELKNSIPKFIKFLDNLLERDFMTRKYNIDIINIYIPPTNSPKDGLPLPIMDETVEMNIGLNWQEKWQEKWQESWQKIEIKLNQRTRLQYTPPPNFCDSIKDTIYEYYGYQKEVGNLVEFMDWYVMAFGISVNPPTVHIVAHSQIMQDFAKTYLHTALSEDKTDQNCWSIIIPYRPPPRDKNTPRYSKREGERICDNIQAGYKKPHGDEKTQAKNIERQAKTGSLCGESGLGKAICSGGRRSRRKRSNRKKTRRRRSRHRR